MFFNRKLIRFYRPVSARGRAGACRYRYQYGVFAVFKKLAQSFEQFFYKLNLQNWLT